MFFFFFNDTATTEIYTLSLHDALPIWRQLAGSAPPERWSFRSRAARARASGRWRARPADRKSTRLNSSHSQISYAVFCLKKKKINNQQSWALTGTQDLVQILVHDSWVQ